MRKSLILSALGILGMDYLNSFRVVANNSGTADFVNGKDKTAKGKKHKSQKIRANRRKAKRRKK